MNQFGYAQIIVLTTPTVVIWGSFIQRDSFREAIRHKGVEERTNVLRGARRLQGWHLAKLQAEIHRSARVKNVSPRCVLRKNRFF